MKDTEKYKFVPKLKGVGSDSVYLGILDNSDEAILKYVTWMSDEEIGKLTFENFRIFTFEDAKNWVNKIDDRAHNFSIWIDGNMVCTCGLNVDLRRINAYLDICIGEKDFRNKGLGRIVICTLTNFAFKEICVHRCAITYNADNIQAERCYKSCGYVECGREHEATFYNGKYADVIYLEKINKDEV